MLLVTGGYDWSVVVAKAESSGGYYLASTELLDPGSSSWRLAGLLPRRTAYMRLATVDNILYKLGK